MQKVEGSSPFSRFARTSCSLSRFRAFQLADPDSSRTHVRTIGPAHTARWHSRPPDCRSSFWAAVVVAWLGSGQRRPSLVVEPNNQRVAAPKTQGCATLPRGASLGRAAVLEGPPLGEARQAHRGAPRAARRPASDSNSKCSNRRPADGNLAATARRRGARQWRVRGTPTERTCAPQDSTSVGGVRCLAARPGRRARRCARVAARCRRT